MGRLEEGNGTGKGCNYMIIKIKPRSLGKLVRVILGELGLWQDSIVTDHRAVPYPRATVLGPAER